MRAVAEIQQTGQALPKLAGCSLASGACGLAAALSAQDAQAQWAATPARARLKILREARHAMAAQADEFSAAISPRLARTKADTLVTELLPLLDACKFLEREAERLLAPRKLGRTGRPLWLGGVFAEVHREPLGHVLVIGPSNFPLFLPGVQTLQALAAGNSVTWKPGAGGAAVAQLFAKAMREAGLPEGLLTVTDENVAAAQDALAAGADKVVFTGSAESGRSVLRGLAETATPVVMELSGADAVFVMPSADLKIVAKAVAFGLRLNGGAVCMSPRRLFASAATHAALLPLLQAELAKVPAVALEATTAVRLRSMLEEATDAGAALRGEFEPEAQRPLVITNATAQMRIAKSDIFAPVISLLTAESMLHALEQYGACDYALTAAVFCAKRDLPKARTLATLLKAGTVLINDVIAPTADPRVPFGGRGASGFGVTRGAEGLLEMTAVKTLLVRRGGALRHLDATSDADTPKFAALIGMVHGRGLADRWRSLWQLVTAARGRS
jgi:aldehyde dehydrogenase (NAD+)